MTNEELQREYDRLKGENERLKAAKQARDMKSLSCKVSEKGAVSVYGMGRFPVTLYGEQWLKLAEYFPKIMLFLKENQDKLTTKAA